VTMQGRPERNWIDDIYKCTNVKDCSELKRSAEKRNYVKGLARLLSTSGEDTRRRSVSVCLCIWYMKILCKVSEIDMIKHICLVVGSYAVERQL